MKKYISILLTLIMVLTFMSACTPKKPSNDGDNLVGENPLENPNEIENENEGKGNSQEVTLYFANKKYADTGDESLEKLIGEKRNIEYDDISLEEAIVRELMNGPEDKENLYSEIPSTAKLIGVEVADGTAFVNFASEGMYGGSMQETFTINQVVASLIGLESVDRVQFLLDGEKGDSLMGHYSIEEPFDKVTY